MRSRPIAIAAAAGVLALGGTAIAAPGGLPFGGDPEEKRAEFAEDLAGQLEGVNPGEVESALEALHEERRAEMLDARAEALAEQLDGVSAEQARAALEAVHEQLVQGFESGERTEPGELGSLLADELGVSEDELREAFEAAGDARLDQAVEDGRITEEQAERLRDNGGPGGFGGPRGPGHGPPHGGPNGPGGFGAPGGGLPDGDPGGDSEGAGLFGGTSESGQAA